MVKSSQNKGLSQYQQKGTLSKHKRYTRPLTALLFGYSAALGFVAGAAAEDKIVWRQVFTYDASQSEPAGVSLDILGIAIGDTFADAKAKLERIAQENGGNDKVKIVESFFRLPTGSGAFIQTKFPSILKLRTSVGEISVYVSSPASGAQVYGVERLLSYYDKTKQVKISTLIPQVAEKYGVAPGISSEFGNALSYRIQFDNRQAVDTVSDPTSQCSARGMRVWGQTERDLNRINPKGDCDVIIDIEFNRGISKDHAKAIGFYVADLERAKAVLTADYQYFRDYIEQLKSGGGETPKL